MNFIIIGILVLVLLINIINISVIVSFAKFITDRVATSKEKAVSIDHHPLYKLYLAGPMVPWANLYRTEDGKYWYDESKWSGIKISILFTFGLILFLNLFLLMFFILTEVNS